MEASVEVVELETPRYSNSQAKILQSIPTNTSASSFWYYTHTFLNIIHLNSLKQQHIGFINYKVNYEFAFIPRIRIFKTMSDYITKYKQPLIKIKVGI